MISVLVWKVYREQRLIWSALAVLAVGIVVLQVTVLEPQLQRAALSMFFCAIAYTYGLLVGAILLAGERESGTAAFLESLPVEHLPVWRVKCGSGAVLVLAQVLFLWTLLLGAGTIHHAGQGALLLLALFGFAILGFAWGLFFSGRTRTSMGALLGAVLGQAVAAPLVFAFWTVPAWLLPQLTFWVGDSLPMICFCVLLAEVLILASGASHAQLDQLRRREPDQTRESGPWRSQLGALIWLELRQTGKMYRWLAAAALAGGLLVPLEVWTWPLLTLLLGVIAGVAVFAGEQAEGTGRFLSEQRLPPGRVWAVKVAVHLTLAACVAFLLLIPAASRLAIYSILNRGAAQSTCFHRLGLFLQWGPYFTLWLGYGFSVGCLCGLLCRKPVIAGVIALGTAFLLGMLWVPSLLVGGLHAWQIWGVPILLLLTTRLLLWSWATGRLGSTRAVVRLAASLSLAVLWFAGAIAYRVVEIPLVKDKLDLAEFEQTLEADRKNEAGLLTRTALGKVARLYQGDDKITGQLAEASKRGWPAEAPELSAWLDRAFDQTWARELAEAARMPLGVVEDVQSQTAWTPLRPWDQLRRAVELLVARGLQRQAQGDPATFVDHLATGLALVRQVRHLEFTYVYWYTLPAEATLLQGVELWLERLDRRPDLLRRALALLSEHEQAIAKEGDTRLLADYLVVMNTVQQPEAWVGGFMEPRDEAGEALVSLVALAWRTPWEQARLQLMVRLWVNKGQGSFLGPQLLTQRRLFPPWPAADETTQLRAHELMLALRIYQAETGQRAKTLQELTPKILASLPVDPVTGGPFGYRLSQGEVILDWMPGENAKRKVPGGQVILTGGRFTFVVPLPPDR